MKNLLTRGLLGLAAVAIPAGVALALPMAANAAPASGQGAQKVAMVANGTPVCGAPGVVGGTVTAHDFVITNLNGNGDVNTTVHLQDTTPNKSYFVVLYDQNCQPQHLQDGSNPVMSTDAQGNGTMTFTSHDPAGTPTSAQVQLFNATDWSAAPLDSPQVPLS